MPPHRTFPVAKIPLKTERTHEENQERAYIAASRRSDRSLEARVESARRASQIHKRRTGRSLRVTEEDVVNEEMYEEEDDDLPSQYRRLTAHLHTGSADFNRRLSAYLSSNVAMRSALDQAITSSYAQQFPNAPQFAHNNLSMPSPLLTQGLMNPPQSPATQNASPSSPHPYRQSPYQLQNMATYRQNISQHHRSASMSSGEKLLTSPIVPSSQTPGSIASRRMSTPASTLGQDAESAVQSPGSSSRTEIKGEHAGDHLHQARMAQAAFNQDLGPFNLKLPTESKQMLGATLNPYDPLTSMMMGGNEQLYGDSSFYGDTNKESNFHPSLEGMNTTLAPIPSLYSQPSWGTGDMFKSASNTFDSNNFDFKEGDFSAGASMGGSGTHTPNEGGNNAWDTFIDDQGWADAT